MVNYVLDDIKQTDIAVVGLAVRVPGARTADQFWNNLANGVESIETRTPEQLLAAGVQPHLVSRANYVPRSALLPDMDRFDADFFGFSPKEAAIMDPQHRQFLECAWEAMEDAALPPERIDGPVGVFAGCGMGSYFYFNVCSRRDLIDEVGMFLLRHTGNDKDFLATRVSYAFDLTGPSLNVQTACSTSLVALHQACQSLMGGECDAALAGGVTIELPHGRGYLHQSGEILSPDGHCRPFDHRAAGTVFGSGVGVVVLKRLSDAIEDGDPIRAVIKATAINNDGASKAGYLAPSVSGQSAAIVEALGLADVSAETIQYVECHGTGTYLGDPIEIAALTNAYRYSTDATGYCHVGSVKSNIGHLDTAAGVVSLVKTILSLENGAIPPTLGFEEPNPAIDFDNSPFSVTDTLIDWPQTSGPRRAAVNSLGVGGTNAHVIVEQAPQISQRVLEGRASGPQVLLVSAKSDRVLDEACATLADHLASHPDTQLEDVAATLAFGRKKFERCRIISAADREGAIEALSTPTNSLSFSHSSLEHASGAAFMFPGGGAQHPGMASAIYRSEPRFAKVVDEGLSYLPAERAAQLRAVWFCRDDECDQAAQQFRDTALQLPAILILEVALARLLQEYGVHPKALIGHSMGEYAAACVSGVMTFETAVQLVNLRGELFKEVHGAMLSVPATEATLRSRLPEEIDIACVNAPELCVVSGQENDLNVLREALEADEIDATSIPIDTPAHSQYLAPILDRFRDFLATKKLSKPSIPIASNLSGNWLTDADAQSPEYWVNHLASTVRFAEGMARLALDEDLVYLEVGPGRGLSALAKLQGTTAANRIVNTLPHANDATDDHLHFVASLGRMLALGLTIEQEALRRIASGKRIRLPTYSFSDQRYFIEQASAPASEWDQDIVRLPDVRDWGWQPVWKPTYADIYKAADRQSRNFLVFADDAGISRELITRLRNGGHSVTEVNFGDTYDAREDGSFTICPESGREGYETLFAALASADRLPDHIIHGWLLTNDEGFRPGSSFFHRNQERGFYSIFFIAQALSGVTLPSQLQMTILANGLFRIGNENLPYPEKATVLGPAQVLPRELAEVDVRVVDVNEGSLGLLDIKPSILQRTRPKHDERNNIIEGVWEEIFARPGSELVAHREGKRWVQGHEPLTLDGTEQGLDHLRKNGVYLITGGSGDIASELAARLAERLHARLILTGRSRLPHRATWQDYLKSYGETDRVGCTIAAILRIEELGGEVVYECADVANAEDMDAVVGRAKERFGRIDGAFHAAGLVRDDLMAVKRLEDIEDVLAPKVQGAMVLNKALRDSGVQFIVLFSSTSTDTAPAGQADYVAANAYLNACAQHNAARSDAPRTLALHWGVWSEVGIAARAIKNAASAEPQLLVEPVKAPLFDRRIRDDAELDCVELKCSAERNWILNEHRLLTGEAIWPGTAYLELALEAARQFGVPGAIEVSGLAFLRPLYVPDGASRTIRVQLKRQSGDMKLVILSRGDDETDWTNYAECTVAALRTPQPPALEIDAIWQQCTSQERAAEGRALVSPQEEHLRFGPRWSVLRAVGFGDDAAIAELSIDNAFQSDFGTGLLSHPALMDIATGFAMDLIPGYSSLDGLWVPAGYGRVKLFQSMPSRVVSYVRRGSDTDAANGIGVFDITIADPDGRTVAEISEFMIRRLDADVSLSQAVAEPAPGAPSQVRNTDAADMSPALTRLAAQVDQGIRPDEGFEALLAALATGLPQVIVSSLDLEKLKQSVLVVADEPQTTSFERPQLDSDFVEPESQTEKQLAQFWTELLGVSNVGVNDNFFDLGGHSLIAVRLFRMIHKTFAVDLPISALLQAPTIAACASLIEDAIGESPQAAQETSASITQLDTTPRQYAHLVPMSPGRHAGATPVFICAGMFGNVLNLRHLSGLLGRDRPVYALQASGLFGGSKPHESFEEMAAANIKELRTIQSSGPYLLAGFSGGGLVAYEMAHQLAKDGEETAMIVMLDTPYPEEVNLSAIDRCSMKAQDFMREGGGYIKTWIQDRVAWELQRRRTPQLDDASNANQFQNDEIEAAFRRALARYQVMPYSGPVTLFRPQLEATYTLRDGRALTHDRCIVKADNGWDPFIQDFEVIEVPGDHDSMVLVPHVHNLVNRMRTVLNTAEHTVNGFLDAAE